MRQRWLVFLALGAVLTSCETFDSGTNDQVLSLLGGLASGDNPKMAFVGRSAQSIQKANEGMTPLQEYTLGRAFAAQLLQTRVPLINDKANHYLNVLGQALARTCDRPDTYAGYHFQLIDSPEVNAFSAPGGLIFVTRGLVDMTHNEDELAAVLAHEIGHVELEHGIKAIHKDRLTKAMVGIGVDAAKTFGPNELSAAATALSDSVTDLTSTIVNSGYSKETEYQADAAAVTILTRAGYPPQALLDMIRSLNSIPEAGKGGFTKTHPSPDQRLAQVAKLISNQGAYTVSTVQQKRYRDALVGL